MVKVTVTIDDELYAQLQEAAARENLTLEAMAQKIVEEEWRRMSKDDIDKMIEENHEGNNL